VNQGERARLLIGPNALKNATLREYVKGLNLNDPELDLIARYRDDFGSKGFRAYKDKIAFNKTLEEVKVKREFSRPLEEKWAQEAEARRLQDNYRPSPKVDATLKSLSDDVKRKDAERRKKLGIDDVPQSSQYGGAYEQNYYASTDDSEFNDGLMDSDESALEYQNKKIKPKSSVSAEKVIAKRKKTGYSKLKPVKLSPEQIEAIKNYQGPRREILLPAGVPDGDAKDIKQAMGSWNTYIKSFAEGLEKTDPSFFNNPDGTPILTDIMDQRTKKKRALVTKKDKWLSDRTLDYGHLGGASSPQFGWMSKWIQNAQPEFSWDNQLSGATMTPTEFVSAMDRTNNVKSSNRGAMSIDSATQNQIKKYSKELKEISSRYKGGINRTPIDSKAYDSLMSLPSVDVPDDIVRSNMNIDDSKYFVLDRNNRIPYSNKEGTAVKDMLTVMQDNPSVDFDATAVLGGYPEEMIDQVRAKPTDGRYMSAFREAVDRIAEYGEPQKLQKLLKIAKEAAGKGVWGVAPIALMMSDPEMANAIDELGIERGSDAWVGLFESVGIKDAANYVGDSWNNAMSVAKSGQYGTAIQAQAGVLDFAADVGKAIVTETPGYVASMNDWIQSNNQAMDAARAQAGVTSADDVARQRFGQLRNIWTNDD